MRPAESARTVGFSAPTKRWRIRVAPFHVIRKRIAQLKIDDSVVSLHAVQMMNDLSGFQRAAEMLLHYKAVFEHIALTSRAWMLQPYVHVHISPAGKFATSLPFWMVRPRGVPRAKNASAAIRTHRGCVPSDLCGPPLQRLSTDSARNRQLADCRFKIASSHLCRLLCDMVGEGLVKRFNALRVPFIIPVSFRWRLA
jgi:hypothetical protein